MNIIYTDKYRNDLGFLPQADVDVAYGVDENNFRITLDINEAILDDDYFFYVPDSDIGGIVDKVNPDTGRDVVYYEGRTWHGILASKVVKPPEGEDYLFLDGNASDVLTELLELVGLGSLFEVEEDSTIEIENYRFWRYVDLYTGIRVMLSEFGGKLIMNYSGQKVHLSVIPLYDYSTDEEWDGNRLTLNVSRTFNPVNHLVCLGSGELSNRHVIELFTDENGGIQDYTLTDNPLEDSDYILDNRNQLFFGLQDISTVFDYSNAQSTENYIVLNTIPEDWGSNYTNYYTKTDTYFEPVEKEIQDYTLLNTEPSDWSTNYANYYYKRGVRYYNVDDNYVTIITSYQPVSHKPQKWEKHYNDYYYRWTDGVRVEYRRIPSASYNTYKKQTERPSDWSNEMSKYYVRQSTKKYVYEIRQKKNGIWKKETVSYYTKQREVKTSTREVKLIKTVVDKNAMRTIGELIRDGAKASEFKNWKTSKHRPFYTRYSSSKAPSFSSYNVLKKIETPTVKPFTANTFYERTGSEKIPTFIRGKYYRKTYDNYADLVNYGVQRLQELWNTNSISITFNDYDNLYDIGDIVGGREHITGLYVTASIIKKIIRIDSRGNVSINYEAS